MFPLKKAHMKKYIIILVAVLSISIFGQNKRQQLNQMRGIFFDPVVLPSETGANCYITYKTLYNRLVFVRENNVFTARFNLSIEAADSATGKVYRDIIKKEFSVNTYAETDLDNEYLHGMIKLSLPAGTFKITPTIYDLNTGTEHLLSPFDLRIGNKELKGVSSPLVLSGVGQDNLKCGDTMGEEFINFEGTIPFSKQSYDLVIPVIDTSVSSINVELTNNDSLIYKGVLNNSVKSQLSLGQCDNAIVVGNNPEGKLTRNFFLRSFNLRLREGTVTLTVNLNKSTPEKYTFQRAVVWYNKPRSLQNTEYAIRLLKYVASEKEIVQLNKNSDKTAYSALFNFWKKFDPTPNTEFNELMAEYYQRVDFAVLNYSQLANRDGAESDRGRIYILYGKPKNVERIYNSSRDVREVWQYDSPGRNFVFVDKSGLGNYILSENL